MSRSFKIMIRKPNRRIDKSNLVSLFDIFLEKGAENEYTDIWNQEM